MDRLLLAIRDGRYNEAIKIAKEQLSNDPKDVAAHFSIAQAYESTGEYSKALFHITECLNALPDSFEALTLAARCASRMEKHEEAYKYAESALKDGRDPNLPGTIRIVFNLLSYIPGLKRIRDTNNTVVQAYAKQTQWLRDYVNWYKKK
jgi:tetratricopeptide (TPR) repeat protein